MVRLLSVLFGLAMICAQYAAAPPAAAQRSASTCRLEEMPPLPADANNIPTATRRGFVFEPGAYRCARGGWSYVPGHWERARRNAVPDPLTMIEVRQGRVQARPGNEIVQQGSQVLLRRSATNPGAGLLGITITMSCTCSATGGCSITKNGNIVECRNHNCSGSCSITTYTPGLGGLRAEHRQILGTTPCPAPPGAGVTARR